MKVTQATSVEDLFLKVHMDAMRMDAVACNSRLVVDRGTHFDYARANAMLEMKRQGYSMEQIAHAFRVDATTVYKSLDRIDSPGFQERIDKRKKREAQARKMFQRGMTRRQIMEETGWSQSTVERYLRGMRHDA